MFISVRMKKKSKRKQMHATIYIWTILKGTWIKTFPLSVIDRCYEIIIRKQCKGLKICLIQHWITWNVFCHLSSGIVTRPVSVNISQQSTQGSRILIEKHILGETNWHGTQAIQLWHCFTVSSTIVNGGSWLDWLPL